MKTIFTLLAVVAVFTTSSAFAGTCTGGGCSGSEGGKKKEAPKDTATLSVRL